jgi:hypothetical protein
MTDDPDDGDDATRGRVNGVREWLDNNRRPVYLTALALLVLWWTGNLPDLPAWWPIVLLAVVAAAGAGYVAAQRILDLLPEKNGYLLIAYEDEQVHRLSPDTYANMTVNGTLYQWSETKVPVYEAVTYRPEQNHALANWKESFPDSEVASEATPSDAIAHVEEYREQFEPELAEARHLKRSVRSLVRKLDKERAESQAAIVDESIAPAMDSDTPVTEMLREELPDDLHPRSGLHNASNEPDADTDTDADVEDEPERPAVGDADAWDAIGEVATDGGPDAGQ